MRVSPSAVALLVSSILATASFASAAQSNPNPQGSDTSRGTAQASAEKVAFKIPAQPLNQALNEYAKQADLRIVFDTADAEGVTAPALNGTLTPDQALKKLLEPTRLKAEYLDDKTIAIHKDTPTLTKTSLGGSEGTSITGTLRLAQNTGATGEARNAGTEGAKSAESTNEQNPPQPSDTKDEGKLQEIIVTGSRLKRPLGATGAVPVTIFNRERIDQLGVTSVADIFNYLPQQSFATGDGSNLGASRVVRLRGLGEGTTLVLINGRRTITSAILGASNSFDLNTIPLAAVDRVDVLSDSASAIYGADAIGGVVNIVLKRNIDRPALEAYLGGASGGGGEYRAGLSDGLQSGRFRGSIVLDAYKRDFLQGDKREFYANQDFRRFGGADLRFIGASPANIFSADGANLPGLPASFAGVPAGSSGVGLTPADFLPTAGQFNVDSFLRFQSVVPAAQRYSVSSWGEFDLADSVTAFTEILYANRRDRQRSSPPFIIFPEVPASNAFNPFGVPVLVLGMATGLGEREFVSRADSWRAVAGLRGKLLGDWDWELSALGIREHGSQSQLNELDPVALAASLASSDPALALNVFQDGPGGSVALLDTLRAAPVRNRFASNGVQFGGFARGSLGRMPAGDLEIVVGAETRSEKLEFHSRSDGVIDLDADRHGSSAFMELRVPVLQPLVLTGAVRYDHYSDFGGTVNPQYGVEWHVTKALLLRGTYGTSFRAPSLFQLYSPSSSFDLAAHDPSRNEDVIIPVDSGGNPNLDAEQAKSWTYGVLLTPFENNPLEMAVTAWKIEQDKRVQALPSTLLLANEARFPDRVLRGPPSAEDIAAGRPGPLLRIDASSINFGRADTHGIDFAISSRIESRIGAITPRVSLTWVDSFKTADFPNTPAVERAGVAYTLGTVPKLRGTSTLGWSRGALALSGTVRYVDSYDDATDFDTPNGRTIHAQTLFDLQGALSIGDIARNSSQWARGITVRAGVINLFDPGPRFAEVGGRMGFDPSQTDTRQRFGYVSLNKAF